MRDDTKGIQLIRAGRGRFRYLLVHLLLPLLVFSGLSWNTAFVDESAALAIEGGAAATAAVEVTMPEGPVSAMAMAAGPVLGKAGLLGKSKTALTKADEAGEAVAKLAGSSAKVSSAASAQAGRVGGWAKAKQVLKVIYKDGTGSIPGKSLKKLAEQKGAAEGVAEKSLLPPKMRINLKGGTEAARGAELATRFGTTAERTAVLQRAITSEGALNTSQTVARQLAGQRNFIPSQSILETIGSGARVADPQGVAGQFMCRSAASFNGSQGTLEVLVHEASGQIRHVLFRSGVAP